MGNIFGKTSLSEEDRKAVEELKAGMQPFLDTGFEPKFAVFETLRNINENEVDSKKNAIDRILSDYKVKGKDINQKDILGAVVTRSEPR